MNLFATVLTYSAPSANYRGESEQNRAVIQRITDGRFEYPVISPEAIRNALRDMLAGYGLPCNRSRLHDEEQLAVKFEKYPNPASYIDDFFLGYLVAAAPTDRKKILDEVQKENRQEPFRSISKVTLCL
jgi:CRISPR-associated protein Cst2